MQDYQKEPVGSGSADQQRKPTVHDSHQVTSRPHIDSDASGSFSTLSSAHHFRVRPDFLTGRIDLEGRCRVEWMLGDCVSGGSLTVTPIGAGLKSFGQGVFSFDIPPVAIASVRAEVCTLMARDGAIGVRGRSDTMSAALTQREVREVEEILRSLVKSCVKMSGGPTWTPEVPTPSSSSSVDNVQAKGVDAVLLRTRCLNRVDARVKEDEPDFVSRIRRIGMTRALDLLLQGGSCLSWASASDSRIFFTFLEEKETTSKDHARLGYEVALGTFDRASDDVAVAYAEPTFKAGAEGKKRMAIACERLFTHLCESHTLNLPELTAIAESLDLKLTQLYSNHMQSLMVSEESAESERGGVLQHPEVDPILFTRVWHNNVANRFYLDLIQCESGAEHSVDSSPWFLLKLSGQSHPAVEITIRPVQGSLSEDDLAQFCAELSRITSDVRSAYTLSRSSFEGLEGSVHTFLSELASMLARYDTSFSFVVDEELEDFHGGGIEDLFSNSPGTPENYGRIVGHACDYRSCNEIANSDVGHHLIAKLRGEHYFRIRAGEIDPNTEGAAVEQPLDPDGFVCDLWLASESTGRLLLRTRDDALSAEISNDNETGSYLVAELMFRLRDGSAQKCTEWIREMLA